MIGRRIAGAVEGVEDGATPMHLHSGYWRGPERVISVQSRGEPTDSHVNNVLDACEREV